MEIGAGGRVATLDNAVSAHPRFGLTEAEARSLATALQEQVADTWEPRFRASGLTPQALQAVRRNIERTP